MSDQYMFINYDEDPLTIEIKAYETVTIYKLEPSGSPLETEVGDPEVPEVPPGYVIFNMEIPAGTVYGFRLEYTPVYDDERENLLVLTAGSKDPWPDPPPTKPGAYSEETWAARYADFLYALSGERPKQQGQREKPAKPAEPAEPTAST
jgi:hypothetical protein